MARQLRRRLIKVNKETLRLEIRQEILKFTPELRENKSRLISLKLSVLLNEIRSEHSVTRLGGFSPLRDEPLWWHSFSGEEFDWLAVHMHDDKTLSFHRVEISDYREEKLGLKLSEEVLLRPAVPDALLVPGVAFDSNKNRLGRGGGYYDRYLQNFSGPKIGIFYSEQERKAFEVEPHDMKLDYIVTDKKIIY